MRGRPVHSRHGQALPSALGFSCCCDMAPALSMFTPLFVIFFAFASFLWLGTGQREPGPLQGGIGGYSDAA